MSSRPRPRSMLASLALAILVAVPFAALLVPVTNASADIYSSISIQIDRPTYAGVSEKVPITITASGGPAADLGGNYSVSYINITASNSTGWSWAPQSPTLESGVFRLNLTMPGEANQTITLAVTVRSTAASDAEIETQATVEFKMKVVDPVMISAVVYNRGNVDAANVTAQFFADGELLKSFEFNVSANGTKSLFYNWTFSSIKRGAHTVTIKIDDPNDVVEFSDGNNVLTKTIYIGEQGNPVGAVLTVLIIIVAILFVLTYMQKPAKRTKKF